MKKINKKLLLNKINISNLQNINGGLKDNLDKTKITNFSGCQICGPTIYTKFTLIVSCCTAC